MKVVCDTNVLVSGVRYGGNTRQILEAALQAEVQVIVSGDHHLLALGTWRGIRILSPADFLRMLDAHVT